MLQIEHGREQDSQIIFEQAITQGEQEHDTVLVKRFENDPNQYNNQDYHTVEHGLAVARRAGIILTKIHEVAPLFVTKRDIALGKYIARGHDRVQNWDPQRVKVDDFWVVKRRRHLGNNERDTAKEMIEYMSQVNNTYGMEVFTIRDMAIVVESQDCTIPTFNPNIMTVVQESLHADTSPIARAVALADIGSAGMDTAKVFNNEGRSLFREENLDMREALKRGYPLTSDWKDYFAWRIIVWGDSQAKWIEGRKSMLETELKGLPDIAKEAVRPLFTKFDDNYQSAKKLGFLRRSLSFEQLVKETGYIA